jgi:hypothetical protein
MSAGHESEAREEEEPMKGTTGRLDEGDSFWNYRVMQKGEQFAIHEVFYRGDGSVQGYTENPVSLRAETLEQLAEELKRYALALERPVLQYAD